MALLEIFWNGIWNQPQQSYAGNGGFPEIVFNPSDLIFWNLSHFIFLIFKIEVTFAHSNKKKLHKILKSRVINTNQFKKRETAFQKKRIRYIHLQNLT